MSISNTEKTVKYIRRKTRRKHSTEEKIRIVLEGLRGEISIAELCRREGINSNLYYRWSKCTSAKHMAPIGPFSKRDFSASYFSSLAC